MNLFITPPPEYLFPIFQNEDEPQNTPPADLFPVFPYENQPQNTPPEVLFPPANKQPANNPPVEYQPIPFGLTDEELLEQDLQVMREYEEAGEREAAARRDREAARRERANREAQYRRAMGLGSIQSESSTSSEEGYVLGDSFS